MPVKIDPEDVENFIWLGKRLASAVQSAKTCRRNVKNIHEAHPRVKAKHDTKVSLAQAAYAKYQSLMWCFDVKPDNAYVPSFSGQPEETTLMLELLHEYIKARVQGAKDRQVHAMSPGERAKRELTLAYCERELAIYRRLRKAINEHLKLWPQETEDTGETHTSHAAPAGAVTAAVTQTPTGPGPVGLDTRPAPTDAEIDAMVKTVIADD